MFSRMPGYYIEDYDAQDFSTFELDTDPARTVEGRYWKISYWLKDGARKVGPVQLSRNYVDLMTKRGGKKLYDDVDASGGTTVAQMPADGRNDLTVASAPRNPVEPVAAAKGWNPTDADAPMLAVNRALGYTHLSRRVEWERGPAGA